MAEGEQVDEAAALVREAGRLEAALERIAGARRAVHEPSRVTPSPASRQVTDRLDTLIAELRLALSEQVD